jgi:hypothetical protein
MKPKAQFLVNTKLIRVIDTGGTHLSVHIALSEGGWIEHNPFPNTQEGICGALMLAADVNAGKFWPRRILVEPKPERRPGLIEDLRNSLQKPKCLNPGDPTCNCDVCQSVSEEERA